MEHRGTLLVVDDDTAAEIIASPDDAALVAAVRAELDEYFEQGAHEPVFELGLAWDAIQRCLSRGALDPERDGSPLDRGLVGGRQLHRGPHVLVSYKTPEEVKEVARELDWIREDELREAYDAAGLDLAPPRGGGGGWEYLWDVFAGLVEFYHFASKQELGVIFTTISTSR